MPNLADALAKHGFSAQKDGHFFSCLSIPLTAGLPPVPKLPRGYAIRPVGDEDLAARADVHRAVWNSSAVITAERHSQMRQLWPYRPEFDLIAVSSESGEAVAYYQGWYDELSGVCLIEPVGTRMEHRRLGLSRAVGITLLHAVHCGRRQARHGLATRRRGIPHSKARLRVNGLQRVQPDVHVHEHAKRPSRVDVALTVSSCDTPPSVDQEP